MSRLNTGFALGALILGATPLLAQATTSTTTTTTSAANVAAGQKVSDTSGGDVGTIDAVAGSVATLNTGTVKVGVPVSSFAANPKGGLVIALTKAQIEQQAAGAQAQAAASIATGAQVNGPQGAAVGKVSAVEGDNVTVDTGTAKARLPKSAFTGGANGSLVIGLTKAQLESAAKAAGGSTPQ